MLTQEYIRKILKYDSCSGDFTWKVKKAIRISVGDIAGCVHYETKWINYRVIRIDGVPHLAHRLAFLYMTGDFPKNQTDHINGDGLDNRWENLRQATHSENQRNRRIGSRNKTGIHGVCFHAGKWRAYIGGGESNGSLGSYNNLLDACCARKSAENKADFHPNHGKR